ncbi:MAG: hypothetical protein VX776_07195 [Planctomycetota bacterium]|nr:hypothetical protein [Planctomycetota bacterium]
MKLQRPQYLMAAIILFGMGMQGLYIDSYTLTPEASTALSSQLDIPPAIVDNSTTEEDSGDKADLTVESETAKSTTTMTPPLHQPVKKNQVFLGRYTVILPNWLSWSLLGASLICFLRTIPWLAPVRDQE